MLEEKVRWRRLESAVHCFKQIQEITLHKTTAVRSITLIAQIIQVRRTIYATYCWRSKDEFIREFLWTPIDNIQSIHAPSSCCSLHTYDQQRQAFSLFIWVTTLEQQGPKLMWEIYIFTQPLRSGRIWHKVNFMRSLTGLNSDFSFSLTICLTKAEEPSLLYYLPIAGGRIIGSIPFPRVLVLCEMQSVSSRIWTRVTVSISYDGNHYTTGTSVMWELYTWLRWSNSSKKFKRRVKCRLKNNSS